MKKLILIPSLFLFTAVGTLGCDVQDFAAGAVVGGVIGAHYGKNKRDDRRYRGDYGHRSRRDHRRYHRGWHNAGYQYQNLQTVAADSAEQNMIQEFATKYNVSQRVASDFFYLADEVEAGNLNALSRVGLDKKAQNRLAVLDMPAYTSVQAFAQNMGVDDRTAVGILSELIQEAKIQFSDVESNVWDICQNTTGSWMTPENLSCSSLSWKGCSPATGATRCAPKN